MPCQLVRIPNEREDYERLCLAMIYVADLNVYVLYEVVVVEVGMNEIDERSVRVRHQVHLSALSI